MISGKRREENASPLYSDLKETSLFSVSEGETAKVFAFLGSYSLRQSFVSSGSQFLRSGSFCSPVCSLYFCIGLF